MNDTCGRVIDYLRLSVTDLCNYRCRYCMPEAGVEKRPHEDILTLEELAEIGEAWAMIIQHILAWCLKSMKGLHRRTAEKGMVQA